MVSSLTSLHWHGLTFRDSCIYYQLQGCKKSSKLTPFPFSNYGTLSPFQITGHLLPSPEYGALSFPFQITGHFLPPSRVWGALISLPNYGTLSPLFQSMGRAFPFQITGHSLPLSRIWGAHFPGHLNPSRMYG